jgi:phosphatidyl-myo-inositol dimannoside synthase
MQSGVRCLALVGDAFGGRGGIAQYNRDLLSALADSGLFSSISVLPRRAPDPFVLPPGIGQAAPRLGRIAYIQSALRGKLDRRVDTYSAAICIWRRWLYWSRAGTARG